MSPQEGLKENGFIFSFKHEMKEYCKTDVDILRKCCLKFRVQMVQLMHILFLKCYFYHCISQIHFVILGNILFGFS